MANCHILESKLVLILHDFTPFVWPLKPGMFIFLLLMLYLLIESSFFQNYIAF